MPVPDTFVASRARIAAEARLLYTLLDAAENAGVIRDQSMQQRWKEIKNELNRSCYEAEAESFFQLMSELDNSGALGGTWLKTRWEALEKRIYSPGEARESGAPW